MLPDGQASVSLAASERFCLVDVQQGPPKPAIHYLVRELQMTAADFNAAVVDKFGERCYELLRLEIADVLAESAAHTT